VRRVEGALDAAAVMLQHDPGRDGPNHHHRADPPAHPRQVAKLGRGHCASLRGESGQGRRGATNFLSERTQGVGRDLRRSRKTRSGATKSGALLGEGALSVHLLMEVRRQLLETGNHGPSECGRSP
jgi:hypothetical protein